jgi:hypothetical protein
MTPQRTAALVPRRCTRCRAWKPAIEFRPLARGRLHSWCRPCERDLNRRYRSTAAYKTKRVAYKARPDVKAKTTAYDRARKPLRRQKQREYEQTPRARILQCRAHARRKLRSAAGARAERLRALIASYDRELARLAGPGK